MRNIFVILLQFNNGQDTLECLESLKSTVIPSGSLLTTVVVDNNSQVSYQQQISRQFPQVVYIQNDKNAGYSGGNNSGIVYALQNKATEIVVMNNDTYVDKNMISKLLETADSYDDAGIVVPLIYFAPGYEFHKGRYSSKEQGSVIWYAGGVMDWDNVIGHHKGVDEVDKGQYSKVQKTEFATGCCMLIKRKLIEKIGIFDEAYFLYYEDSDLSERAKKAGFRVYITPNAKMWHKNASATGGAGSSLQDYYLTRNRLYFGFKYASLRAKVALLKESIRLLTHGRKWQKRGISDFYLRRMGKGTYKK